MFKEHYNHIKTQLETIPEIKVIEWYLEQDDEKGGIINTPCVFVNFEPAEINALTKDQQEVIVDVELILYTDFKKSKSKIADDTNRHISIMADIRSKMYCFEETGHLPMERDNGLIRSSVLLQDKFVEKRAKKPAFGIITPEEFSPEITEGID